MAEYAPTLISKAFPNGRTKQTVLLRIKREGVLPNVLKIDKVGNQYILTVEDK